MIIRPPALRPMKFARALLDRQIIDARETQLHKPVLIELPILIAVRAKPLAILIVPLIRETHRDAIICECPEFLDQTVLLLPLPFALQKVLDLFAPR